MNFRYLLLLSYNGKNYHGWQAQPNAVTVQGKIQDALWILLKHKICLHGAGRTDTGVHATFFVAHFDTLKKITDLSKFKHSMNGILPQDIRIHGIMEVSKDFHSRFSAQSRTYHYFINRVENPFLNDFSYYFRFDLDIEKMREGAKILMEYDDFKSFEKAHSDNKTSICKIYEAEWYEHGNLLVFKITADRFLRNMVRSIVGTLIDLGRRKIDIQDFRKIIEQKDRSAAGSSAVAKGLFLTDIKYPEEIDIFLEKYRNKNQFFCR